MSVAVCCSVLQFVAVVDEMEAMTKEWVAVFCSMLQ